MCGIFGYIGPRSDAAELVLAGLKSLEYRGYDSWGVAVVPTSDRMIAVKKKAGKIGQAHVTDLPKGSMAMGHTRWATHGGVTDANAHPHLDCSGTIALIHNGIFENYAEVKEKLAKAGHTFISETDTEVAVHLIEVYAKKLPFVAAVQKAFNEMDGLNAIIAINTVDRQLVAARNGSPLVLGFGKKENFLASDPSALLPYTKQVYFLEDDEMAVVTDSEVKLTNVRTGKSLPLTKQKLEWDVSQTEMGKYPDFMLKEVYEQPKIISNIGTNGVSQAEKIAVEIQKARGSYLVGCGTAAYACLAGTYLFSKVAKTHINWAIGSEFGYHLDFLTKKSLVIALSQSGETIDILESVKKAQQNGAKIMALVNVLGSSLYRMADMKVLVGAGPEKSVASTKDFTGKIAHLVLLAYALDGRAKEGQKVLKAAVKSMTTVLNDESVAHIKKLAKKLSTVQHMYVVGRGLSYPASLETALKIKELSYVHAEGLAAGELKHGPLALVEPGTPCIVFLPNDETFSVNLAAAMEMKARGGYIVGIAAEPNAVFDYHLPVADAKEATLIPQVVTGQLLAYYMTKALKYDVDKPRNLAKSVTVK